MGLKRSLAAIASGAVLIGASILVAAPATAQTYEDGNFTVTVSSNTVSPSDTTYPVSGTGCAAINDKPSEVFVAAYNEVNIPLVQKSVTPEADGSWSLDLDLTLPSPQENDIWTIVAECVSYDNVTQQAVSFPLIFDSTPFNGTFTIEGEPGAQNFRIEATGLTPGETATINLVSATDPTVTHLVGTVVVDADGSVNAVFAAPNVPDGTYYLEIFGDHHGEGGQSADRIKVSNGVYSIDDGNNNIVPPTTDPADPTAAPSAAPTATAQPALAKTGVNGTTLALAALGLTGLGAAAAFVASRRKA